MTKMETLKKIIKSHHLDRANIGVRYAEVSGRLQLMAGEEHIIAEGTYGTVFQTLSVLAWFSEYGMLSVKTPAGSIIARAGGCESEGIEINLSPEKDEEAELPLLFAEVKNKELLSEGDNEKDVFLYAWGDPMKEDPTYIHKMENKEIEESIKKAEET